MKRKRRNILGKALVAYATLAALFGFSQWFSSSSTPESLALRLPTYFFWYILGSVTSLLLGNRIGSLRQLRGREFAPKELAEFSNPDLAVNAYLGLVGISIVLLLMSYLGHVNASIEHLLNTTLSDVIPLLKMASYYFLMSFHCRAGRVWYFHEYKSMKLDD